MPKKFLKKILPSDLIFLYKIYKGKLQKFRKMPLLRFGINLVDHCILNCKHCNHFAPIASKNFLDISVLEKGLQKLSELSNKKIGECKFLGGEPLLHPDIIEAITIFRKYFPPPVQNKNSFNQGLVLTNGILLLKMPEEFWKCCRKNQITIRMTKYPINLDFAEIEKKCADEKVSFLYSAKTGKIQKTLYAVPLDLSGKQNYKNSFYMCRDSNSSCTSFRDGKIFPCHIIANIHHFNNYFDKKLNFEESDYIDIFTANTIDDILSFLTKPKPFCRYCMTGIRQTEIPWETSKKEISEWVL